MKKLVRSFGGLFLGAIMLLAVVFVGRINAPESIAEAAEQPTIYGMTYEYQDTLLEIDNLIYTVDGIRVEYKREGFEYQGEMFYYKAEFNGVSGALGLMEGEARTQYFVNEPFLDVLDGFGMAENRIPADPGTDVYCSFVYLTDGLEKLYYVSDLSYRVGIAGSYYAIDQSTVDDVGGLDFAADYDDEGEFYSQTININYTFNYNYQNKVFWIKAVNVASDITMNIGTEFKMLDIEVTGSGSSIVTTNAAQISYSNLMQIDVSSTTSYIIDKMDLYFGTDKVITFYGGMQTSGTYFFKNGVEHEKVVSYGNFALAYETDLDYVEVESQGNYAEIRVEDPGDEDINEFTFTLSDTGKLTITSRKISKKVTVDISIQRYIQLDLVNKVGGDEQFSSAPYSLVQFGSGDDAVVYDENIPARIFLIGVTAGVDIKVQLKDGYNFTSKVAAAYIDGRFYIREMIGGGHYTVYAEQDETMTLTILLKNGKSNFSDSNTRIYISTRDISDVAGFDAATELSATSRMGQAIKRGIPKNTVVKIYVEINPYYMMDVGGVKYAKQYSNFEYLVTDNQTIEIEIEKIAFERPVTYKGEVIGTLLVKLDQCTVVSGVYASYQVAFKQLGADSFSVITKTNPNIYGYNLQNMYVDGAGLFKYYNDGTFGIDPSNQAIHERLASVVFNVPDNGLEIQAIMSAKLIDFNFEYNGETYNGKVYYTSNEIFLDKRVEVVEPGCYFGGIYYENPERVELLTTEGQEPVQMVSGTFAGMYVYQVSDAWMLDDPSATITALILYSTFEVEFVFTTSEEDYQIIKSEIKYNTEFTVDDFNGDNLPAPVIGEGYNLIGWKVVTGTDQYFVKADEYDYLYHASIIYLWEEDVRLIPVFSAGTAIVTIYDDEGNHISSSPVRFGDLVSADIEKLLKSDGEWIVCAEFGYLFKGFYDHPTAGNLVISYRPIDPPYVVEYESNTAYFAYTEGVGYTWATLTNLDLYAQLTAIEYSLDLQISNPDSKKADDIEFSAGILTKFSSEFYYLYGFNIADTLVLSGIAPKEFNYLTKITVVSKVDVGDVIKEDLSYFALCNKQGEVIVQSSDLKYDTESQTFTLVVADYITEGSGANKVVVSIEYLPITYMVSFEANIVGPNGEPVKNDASEKVYYKFTRENATASMVDNWIPCDADGNELGLEPGWIDLVTPTTGLEFPSYSLYGISGISYTDPSGVIYSFKEWRDFDKDFTFIASDLLTGGYDFVSMFSDVYDVTLNYHIYNNITGKYELSFMAGYFWSYDVQGDRYFIEDCSAANAYEIYFIGGDLYFISAWTDTALTYFGDGAGAGMVYPLNRYIDVAYEAEAFEVDLYAIYDKFSYSLSDNGTQYVVDVNLPNDPNGNSYSETDIVWLGISKVLYDNFDSTNLTVTDKLSNIIFYGGGVDSYLLNVGSTFPKSQTINEQTYLFAAIQRKLNGVAQSTFYLAIKVI